MAKHKAQRALFDLLRGESSEQPAQAAAPKAAPVIRRTPAPGETAAPAAPISKAFAVSAAEAARREAVAAKSPPPVAAKAPPPVAAKPAAPAPARPQAPRPVGRVSVTYNQLVLAGVAAICLCAIAFAIGLRAGSSPEALPRTEKHPTFGEVQGSGVTPGLVPQRPPGREITRPPAPVAPAGAGEAARPGGAKRPVAIETPSPASATEFRVRIARLSVSQPDAIDKLRTFLSQKGVETDLETRGGFYMLYSRERFPDKKKSDELAAQIKKQLEAFEKQTKIPTATDAYSVEVKKE